jgi:L-seryl-tRNA(Ser) seleniumtransferase
MLLNDLGAIPIINAHGTLTVLGGSVLSDEILDAMKEASEVYLDMPDLQIKAGRYISQIIGCEDALVTSGGGAGLALSVAACMTMGQTKRMAALPNTDGFANRVIIQKQHRNFYDYIVQTTGAEIIEIGEERETTSQDLEQGIAKEKISSVLYFAYDPQDGVLPLDQVIKISNAHGIPVIVDAAAELPPAQNLKKFLDMGADLVIFSGGKDLGAPNDTGLVLGRRDLVDSCRRLGPHSYETFNSETRIYIGRAMKTSKEDILAVVAAVKRYLRENYNAGRLREWERKVDYIVSHVSGTGYGVRRITPDIEHPRPATIPRVEIDPNGKRINASAILERLRSSSPPIYAYSIADRVYLNPQCLQVGEEAIVAERLVTILSEK